MSTPAEPDGPIGAEDLGVRVFALSAADPQQLADQIAITLGEHLDPDDELHITHGVVPNGWLHTPGRDGWRGHPAHTQIAIEYSALLVLRSPARNTRPGEPPAA
ncbi:MAG: hypothetical protein ACRDMJ_09295 [Solirubrobacteraceae bacterium]